MALLVACLNPEDKMDVETWNKAIEAAALIVEPNPFVEEERECKDVAKAIRALKIKKRAI